MKKILLVLLLGISGGFVSGQNPIVPAGVYLADPSARVWEDGKLYIYGSSDESTSYYCSHSYDVLSTSDLVSWNIAHDVFSSVGDTDQVMYSDEFLYAPDCEYKEGTYYLYYCQSGKEAAEGIAFSDSPVGPFKGGKKMEVAGIEEIDPAVFIDDDGQAYYIWGQFDANIAKLNTNMSGIDPSTVVEGIVTESEHYFHEGSFMFKRNGIYYLVYADVSRGSRPTCLGYSTSDSPQGPFTYRGVIIDNDHCDPSTWNNHGSVAEYMGQWYVFYHRSTHNSRMMRKACVEPIHFNEDGTINEVEMTSQGAGPALDAFIDIEAERACLLFGRTYINLSEPGNEKLTEIHDGDSVAYKDVNFGDGVNEAEFRVKLESGRGIIVVRLDHLWGPIISLGMVKGGEGADWQTVVSKVKPAEGIHALFLSFHGGNGSLFELDRFKFNNRISE